MAVEGAATRKARGAFFTPPDLCRYVADWAVRSATDDILEPSCGEAAFLLAAGERLDALARATGANRGRLDGVELHGRSAREAERAVRAAGHDVRVQVGDFFLVTPTGTYDAVVGNPPYVRYQDFSGVARARRREAALRAGVPLTGLASSWAAFTVHAALFLKTGGRLGLVLPAELLTVNYAAEVRRFLMERFARVRLVLFTERVFPGVLEEVVLLLADGYDEGPASHCELHQVRTAADLSTSAGVARLWKPRSADGKWTPSLMSTSALAAYIAVESADDFTTLHEWGETTLGMVTGNNRYFAVVPGTRPGAGPSLRRTSGALPARVTPSTRTDVHRTRHTTHSAPAGQPRCSSGLPASPRRRQAPTSRQENDSRSTQPTSAGCAHPGGEYRWSSPPTCC